MLPVWCLDTWIVLRDHKADQDPFFDTDHREAPSLQTNAPALLTAARTLLFSSQIQGKEDRIRQLQKYIFHVQHREAKICTQFSLPLFTASTHLNLD